MSQPKKVSFEVNGKAVEAEAGSGMTLLRYLRDELGLKGTKNGCDTGDCGACTVLIDGKAAKSCLLKLPKVAGKRVETIESLSIDGRLHPIQAAFLVTGGIQCGFCTPGMIMATKALLSEHPHPTDAQIKAGLKENICRCTGYNKIIDAVKLAAEWTENPGAVRPAESQLRLAASIGDLEGAEKALGTLAFADDMEFEGMLYGKVLWSDRPHAEILSLDTSRAKALPGVIGVFTAADVPGHNGMGVVNQDLPVLCKDRVRFVADAVAVVFAESPDLAKKALGLIDVKYRDLPGVFSPQEALAPDAPQLHEKGNICKHLVHEVGDIAKGFQQSALVVEGHFETPAVEHAYLEPEAAIGVVDKSGMVVVYVPIQYPFELRRQLALVLNLPEEKVRVVVTPVGGAFGSRNDATIEALVALGAIKLGRPVKITLTRRESLRVSTKRHPYSMDYRVGLSANGEILAVDARLLSDAGPYSALSPRVIDQACIFSCGPYRVPNLRVEGWAVFTNNSNSSAFRGFGINQGAVAIESLLDEAAQKLGMDPIDLRLRNALRVGDQTSSGEILKASVAAQATLIEAKKALEAEQPWIDQLRRSGRRIGVGVACGYKNVGAGKGKIDDAGAIFTLLEDGKVELRASAVDMGQGIRTALAQIAGEVLRLSPQRLVLITGDTFLTLKHGGAAGERQTLIAGKAVELSARQFTSLLLDKTAEYLGVSRGDLRLIEDGVAGADGRIVLGWAELARHAAERGERLETSYYYVAPKTYALSDKKALTDLPPEEYRNFPSYAYTTQVAVIDVQENGEVQVLKILAAHDCGRAINPQKIEGQIEGSCMQGIGYALSESYPLKKGKPTAVTYGKLGVPTIERATDVVTILVEDPEPTGPFGAKGISEVATVPVTPAILNAIADAVGLRARSLPVTPAVIRKHLAASGATRPPA